jgi:hypothetical protein
MAGALFIFLAGAARAQDAVVSSDPARISVSGRIDLTAAWRGAALNEAAAWVPGGSALRGGDTFVLPDLAVRFDLVAPGWRAAVEIGNTPLDFDSFDPRLQNARLGESASLEVDLRQAWVDLFEAARLGLQPLRWDPGGRGDPLFFDPAAAESPWGELPDATVPPFPALGTSTVPQTRRDVLHPLGLSVRLDAITVFALILAEGGPSSADEVAAGASVLFPLGPLQAGAIGVLLAGGDGDRRVGTIGISLQLDAAPFSIGAEAYAQAGTAGRLDADGDGDEEDLRARGGAFRVAARWSGPAWARIALAWVSGDDEGTDDREGRFLSYEDNDASMIVEGNEFGLDVDSNYRTIQVSAGFETEVLGLRIQPRALIGLFALDEKVPLPPDPLAGGRSNRLGTELDAGVDLPWSPQVLFYMGAAILLGSEVLETFTAERDDSTFLATAGLRLRF